MADDVQIIPADDLPLTPEEQLEQALATEDDPTFDIETYPPDPEPFGRSWLFDFAAKRYTRYGTAPAVIHGLDTLRNWIEKTIYTSRMTHPVYDDTYGVDRPTDMIGQPPDPALNAEYTRRVQDALLVHNRIVEVDDFDFEFNEDQDAMDVTFTVRTDTDDNLLITVPSAGAFT